MKIKIYFFGKKSDKIDLEAVYLKRIGFSLQIETIALPQAGIKEAKVAKQKEAQSLLSKITDQDFLVVLDERGKTYDSNSFSQWFKATLEAKKEINFVIGGAHGLDQSLLERANLKLSFGAMVWTKNLARLMLEEQIYRALEIAGGKNFHKA